MTYRTRQTGTDREGFEPSMPSRAYRFSRPAVSTAHPPVQTADAQTQQTQHTPQDRQDDETDRVGFEPT